MESYLCLTFIALLSVVTGDITMQGCTEAYIRLTCPNDDIIHVSDMRLVEQDKTSKACIQSKPGNVQIPKELSHVCGSTECIWIEGICDGKSDCAFYVSPHLIGGEERPTEDSVVEIIYTCTAGKGRKAGVIVVGLLAAVGAIAILAVGGLLLYRVCFPHENYDTFDNVGGDTPGITPTGTPTPGRASSASARYEAGTEHISVELQSPGPNNNQSSTKA